MGTKVHHETAFASAPGPDVPAVVDGKYRLESKLGEGGMGVVYRARHLGLEKDFALKLIRFPGWPAAGGRSFAERFRTEAMALGRLRHPGIVAVTDYGIDTGIDSGIDRGEGGLPYLVMEHLEGTTLRDLCAASGALPLERALPLFDGIAQALDHAHERGVLHRDLKPANVFLCGNPGESPAVKILDFGLARLVDGGEQEGDSLGSPREGAPSPGGGVGGWERVGVRAPGRGAPASPDQDTRRDAFPGTPAYLAPEVARGEEAGRASDLYSFGVLAYEVLAGRPPFTGRPEEIRAAHRDAAPPLPSALNPALPPELDAALLAPLAKRPEDRPATAAGVVAGFRAAALRAGRRQWRAREVPRRLALAALLAPAVLLASLALGSRGPFAELERRSVDARFAALPTRPPDPRILLVAVDEATLAADPTPLAERGEELGRELGAVLAAGARGVAVDFLLPERWSRSPAFSRLVLEHAERLTLAAYAQPAGEIVGPECVAGLTAVALGPERLSALFGLVNLDEDADGVIRRVRLSLPERGGGRREAWAARAAGSITSRAAPAAVWIDPSIDWRRFDRISWKDLPARLARDPSLVRGRLVLVGGDFAASGDDDHRIPGGLAGPATVPGIVLQALLVDSLVSARAVREAAVWPWLVAAGLACALVLAAVLCLERAWLAAGVLAALGGLIPGAAFLLFRETRILVPLVAPLLAGLLSFGAGWLLRRRLPGWRPGALAAALAALLLPAALTAETSPPPAVAVVASLAGQAEVAVPPGREKKPLRAFDWLPAGSAIEVGPGAAVVLAFLDGSRWELKAGARATLAEGGPHATAGDARALPPLPPLPRLAAIDPRARAGKRSGAIRIRAGGELGGLSPRDGAATLADGTVLRFAPREDASRYEVEVEDEGGTIVFAAETRSAFVEVPAGILRPGSPYLWRVRTLDRTGPPLRGEGSFQALTAEDAGRRAALEAAVKAREDAGLESLLAAIDRRLGLPAAGEPAADPAAEALAQQELGIQAWKQGDLAAAEEHHRRALEIREKLAPDSLDVAASLNELGNIAARRDDPSAEDLYRRSLALRERLAPGSVEVATSLNNLGNLLSKRGELLAAEEHYRRALAINERVAPGSIHVARNLNNLGIVASDRGDLAVAEDYHRRALALREKAAPESLLVAGSLNNLGAVAVRRGDLAAAEELYRRALALAEKLAPGTLDVAWALNNLGVVAYERRDLVAAEELHRRALAIKERLAPGSSDVAATLSNLGNVAFERKDLSAAEGFYRRALEIDEKLAPGSLAVASTLHNLGAVALDRGDPAAAAAWYRRALAIRERLVPASADLAESLDGLGSVQRRSGRPEEAADLFRRAVETLEAQNARLGGTEEARSAFGARNAALYRNLLDALLALGRPAEALHVLERSRARSLLAMLAERDLLFAADLPAAIAGERRRNAAEYDRVQAAVARLEPARDEGEIELLLGRLRELRAEREEIAARIRRTSPRFAALQDPRPLDFAGVRRTLDPGTALLAYSVGGESTVLFVVRPDDAEPAALRLPVDAKSLREKVETLRRLIERRDPAADGALTGLAGDLYRLLVAPAEGLIAPARRLLVSPDGPLHSLPFAALLRGDGRFLAEWKPLHGVVSATVYAELAKARRSVGEPAAATLAAFGDPRYPPLLPERAGETPEPELRSLLRRGLDLVPLPATRREVEGIAALYPGRARTYLGEEATEERAKSLGKDARYVHFACHGLLDERFPLSSALALSVPESPAPGRDNGLLQTWEIFEQVRLDADLVTLSACETALGQEMGGEGLVGLARAFQYAGARSVLASLWGVGDDSTAELMKRFYGYLEAGKTKDEALRAAQLDLLRGAGGGTSHPFHWAAFVLIGDWR